MDNQDLNDFKAIKSKNEFKNLINQAKSVQTLSDTESRDESYYNVGKAVVCNCNLLIVIWNSEPVVGEVQKIL